MDDMFYPITDVCIANDTLLSAGAGLAEDEPTEDDAGGSDSAATTSSGDHGATNGAAAAESIELSELADGTETSMLAQNMEISQPLNHLRQLLQSRLGINLRGYIFTLQDTTELDSSRTLVDQCVQGQGMVQVNVEISNKDGVRKINIVDVLKPASDALGELMEVDQRQRSTSRQRDQTRSSKSAAAAAAILGTTGDTAGLNKRSSDLGPHSSSVSNKDEQVTKWVLSPEFKLIMARESIPSNPRMWQPNHTETWFRWAARHFHLPEMSVNPHLWRISGRQLHAMTHNHFLEKVPYDPSDLMWTHIELMKKCKIVAIVQSSGSATPTTKRLGEFRKSSPPQNVSSGSGGRRSNSAASGSRGGGGGVASGGNGPLRPSGRQSLELVSNNRTGSNGQVQLWQFLLELLTDKDAREYIVWSGEDGEFKLTNPEMVAQLWGLRKNKPTMNYEKLSRALRYYYDGDMISKVQGKRFAYKFVVDLKQLIGYDAGELNRLVMAAEQKKIQMSLKSNNNSAANGRGTSTPLNGEISI